MADGEDVQGWERRETWLEWKVGGFARVCEGTWGEEAYGEVVPCVVDAPVAACQAQRIPMTGTGHKDRGNSNHHSTPSGEACAAVREDPEGSLEGPVVGLHEEDLAED